MGDFYSVLKQSIIDRGLSEATAREEAYAQARRAMTKRLWSYDPPLSEDEIDHRIGQFDTAVARIEDDVAEVFATMATDGGIVHDDAPADADRPDDDYAPAFGGAPIDDGHVLDEIEEEPPVAVPPPRVRRRSLDEASLAVERALQAMDDEPAPPPPVAAHDEDVAGWSHADPADDADDEPEPGDERYDDASHDTEPELEPAPAASAPPMRKPPAAAKPAPKPERTRPSVAERLSEMAAAALPATESGRVRALAGIVGILSVLLVGGLVWLLLPASPSPPAGPAVVLQTEVPGGVSDPDTAIRLPKEAVTITSSFSLFDGRDPTVFASDPDNPVRFDGKLARIATSSSSAGAKVIIGAGLSSRLAGKTVRVTLDARSAAENGADTMRFAYQSGVAISHWQTADLGKDFTELGLVWRVPTMRTNPSGDYIVIEPGFPGSGTGVEIRSVRIDLVDQ